jgi:hypothetical protein
LSSQKVNFINYKIIYPTGFHFLVFGNSWQMLAPVREEFVSLYDDFFLIILRCRNRSGKFGRSTFADLFRDLYIRNVIATTF